MHLCVRSWLIWFNINHCPNILIKPKRVYPISKPRKRKAVKIQYQSTSTFLNQFGSGTLQKINNQYPAYAFKSDDSQTTYPNPTEELVSKTANPVWKQKESFLFETNPLFNYPKMPMLPTTAMMAKNQTETGINLLIGKTDIVKPNSWKINSWKLVKNFAPTAYPRGSFFIWWPGNGWNLVFAINTDPQAQVCRTGVVVPTPSTFFRSARCRQ